MDKLASKNPDKSQIIKKCREMKKRGEKSIRLLKENSLEADLVLDSLRYSRWSSEYT